MLAAEEENSIPVAMELETDTDYKDFSFLQGASIERSFSEDVATPSIASRTDTETKPIVNYLYRQEMTIELKNSKLNDWKNIHAQVSERVLALFPSGNKDQENKQKLSLELEYLTNIQNLTLQSVEMTVSDLSKSYESQLFSKLKSHVNREDFDNLKNLVDESHEQLINSELEQLDHLENLKIVKVLMNDKVKSIKRSALEAKHSLEKYESVMNNHFLENLYFSVDELEDLHNNAVETILQTSNSSNSFRSFVEHVLSLEKKKFLLQNAQIRKQEQQLVEDTLKKFYKRKLQTFLQIGFRRHKEIKGYHEEICNICVDIVTENINLRKIGLCIDDLMAQLEISLSEYLVANEIKMDRAIEEINKTIGELQSRFHKELKQNISEKTLTDAEFNGLLDKTKNTLLNELNYKIERLCPEEKDSRYTKMFLQMIEIHGINLKKENNAKLSEEENKGCEMPLIVIDFCVKHSRVGILHREPENNLLKQAVIEFHGQEKVLNNVTFKQDGDFIVGESANTTCGNTLQLITIEGILNGKYSLKNLTLPGKKDGIPINFQFISALIFRYIKNECDKVSNSNHATAIIVLPIWFGSLNRQNIKDAATIAGFKQCFLINNTSAAALYHFKRKPPIYELQTHNSRTKISSKEPHLLVLTNDEAEYCTAVYKKGQGSLKMVSNFGDCRLSKSIFGKKQNILTVTYSNHAEDLITDAIIVSEDENLLFKYTESFSKRGISAYYLASERHILRGAIIFAEALANTIISGRDSVLDKTFYNLSIYDKSKTNRIVINQGTCCLVTQEFRTAYYVPKKAQEDHSVRIYEEKGDEKQTVEFVQIKTPIQKRHTIIVNCTVDRENIFGINSLDSLHFKDSRFKTVKDYIEVIRNNLEKDEEMELKKIELTELVQHIQSNINKVNRILEDEIIAEAEKAMQRINKPDFSKEEAQEFLDYFKRIKIRA